MKEKILSTVDGLTDRIDVSYVIDEISFPKVYRDLSIKAGFFEDTSSLPLARTVHSVHRARLGAYDGP